MLPGDLIVCYAATNDRPVYPEYVSRSLYSLGRSNPGVRVRVYEGEYGAYPYNVLVSCIPANEPPERFVAIMDADTWVNGDLRSALPGPDEDIGLRVANVWTTKKLLDREAWWAICDAFEFDHVPVYSNGLMTCRGDAAAVLREELLIYTNVVRLGGQRGDFEDPLRLKHRPPWWMADQFALSLIVAKHGWRVREFGPEEISWNYKGESGGVVHHLGKKTNPFEPLRWKDWRQNA